LVGGLAFVSLAGCGGSEQSSSPASAPSSTTVGATAPHGNEERKEDLPTLSGAEVITRARRVALVTTRSSAVVEGAPGTPFTRTEFKVERLLKGTLADTFVVQVIGGRLGGVRVESPVQEFVKDHRYILFLGDDGPAGPTIIPQLVLEVVKSGSVDVVKPSLTGIPILGAGTAEPAKPSPSGQRLDDVVFSIAQYVKE
jgi:hypothetical protein